MCELSQPEFLVEAKLVQQCDVNQVVFAYFEGRDVAPVDPAVDNFSRNPHGVSELFPVHDRDGWQLRHRLRGGKVHVMHLYKPLQVNRTV